MKELNSRIIMRRFVSVIFVFILISSVISGSSAQMFDRDPRKGDCISPEKLENKQFIDRTVEKVLEQDLNVRIERNGKVVSKNLLEDIRLQAKMNGYSEKLMKYNSKNNHNIIPPKLVKKKLRYKLSKYASFDQYFFTDYREESCLFHGNTVVAEGLVKARIFVNEDGTVDKLIIKDYTRKNVRRYKLSVNSD